MDLIVVWALLIGLVLVAGVSKRIRDTAVTLPMLYVLFGLAAGGLLWLVGLVRKRAALACAVVLTIVFLAARWQATSLVTIQLVLTSLAGRVLWPGHRLRTRDVIGLTAASAAVTWGLFVGTATAYWNAAAVGALVGAAGAWTGRAGSDRWPGAPLRLLTLRPAASGGMNGPGIVTGMAMASVLAAAAVAFGALGPGEPALALLGAALGAALSDFFFRGRPGMVLGAGALAAVIAAGLVAYLP